MLDHVATVLTIFWSYSILFSTVPAPVCIPTNSALGFPFLHSLTSTCCLLICLWWPFWPVLGDIYCGFNLHFLDDKWHWTSFHMSIGHLCVLFGEMPIVLNHIFFFLASIPCVFSFYLFSFIVFFPRIVCFSLVLNCMSSLYIIFWILTSCWMYRWQICSPIQ